MKFVLNKYPIAEDIIVAELRDYFAASQFEERFPNFGLPRVSNDHPFATLLMHEGGGEDWFPDLFPSITVVAGSDAKPNDLTNTVNWESTHLTAEDVDEITAAGYAISAEDLARLHAYFDGGVDDLWGLSWMSPMRDDMSFEVWAENIQVKNELYNEVRAFLAGPWRLDLARRRDITIHDASIRGQRGNNYNLDFGRTLYGGRITVDVDYYWVQAIYDSEWTTSGEVFHHYGDINPQ